VNPTIHDIYATASVVGRSGNVHRLHSAIDREEGEFLFNLIQNDPDILETLEVGCGYGLSSLYICSAIRERAGACHTIIDPFQNTQWDGVGTMNLEAAGLGFFRLIEVKSELALPRLLEQMEGKFDFVFIDGWHTFDHTLVDCFYATRLLRVGGYLAIDDVAFPSVRRVVDFLRNYPCYEFLGSVNKTIPKSWKGVALRSLMLPVHRNIWARILSRNLYRRIFEDRVIRMAALRKMTEDSRNWDWHNDEF
jgi:predicted O-methyltransferase YrrM